MHRGEDWGTRTSIPEDAVTCSSDAAASRTVSEARRARSPMPSLLLTGGSLFRTLGGVRAQTSAAGAQATLVECNVGEALLDGKLRWFIATVTMGRNWLSGDYTIVANAAHLGHWNIAPRAHPGDDRLDLIEARLTFSQRVLALRRLKTGSHVPHPGISVSQFKSRTFTFGRHIPVTIDGAGNSRHRNVAIRVADFRVPILVA